MECIIKRREIYEYTQIHVVNAVYNQTKEKSKFLGPFANCWLCLKELETFSSEIIDNCFVYWSWSHSVSELWTF